MKTKIIYISGGENLDRLTIKAAFDEVRQTLGLGDDTLLFGVPLEDEATQQAATEQSESVETATEIQESAEDTEQTPESERVIPILSVLSGGKTEPVEEVAEEIAEEAAEEEAEEIVEETVQIVSISDFEDALEEDLPQAEQRIPQTIEEIFENLTPLPEEKIIETPRMLNEEASDDKYLDDDATLAMLAAEFVETEKEKPASAGGRSSKIGKLKNILPFKKAKKDESGMLNDLFGWAGIAANEDDAGPSGFFAAR
ncbi:MAG: hypothetical protein WC137_02760 [Alphaproteobacteria bacterium]